MRWKRWLLIALALVLLVVGAGAVFLLTLDLNDYRHSIERIVERQTGRTLAIDGRIDLDIGRHTALTVTDTRFGNPDWATAENMARVQRVSVVVNLRSLWSGPVIIELLELDNAEINLEQRESGDDNWTFGDGGGQTGGGLVPLLLRQAHVSNFKLTVTIPTLDQPQVLHIERLDQVQKSNGLFDAKLRGELNGRSVNITGEYGPLDNLLAARNLTLNIAGQFDTLSISAAGFIDDLTRPRRPRADIQITGPDIDDVTRMLGLPDLGNGDLDLTFSLQPGQEALATEDLALLVLGNVGEHRIESTGAVSGLVDFERVALNFSVQGSDLHKAARLFGRPNFPEGPYQLSGSVTRDGSQLDLDEINLDIGEAKMRLHGLLTKFPNLTDANLTLDIQGPHVGRFTRLLGFPGIVEGPFQITGQLEVGPDGVEIVKLDVDTQIAELTASGTIGSEPQLVGTRVSMSGRGADIAHISGLLGIPLAISESFTFSGDIELVKNAVLLPVDAIFTIGDHQLIAAGRIGFDSRNDADLRLRIDGKDFSQLATAFGVEQNVPPVSYETSARLQIKPEGYRISGLEGRLDDTSISADGLISRQENFVGSRMKIGASGTGLSKFLAGTESLQITDGPFDVSGEVELLADSVRLKDMDIKLGDASGTIDADIGLPLEAANGTYDVFASGRSFQGILPDTGPWEPPDAPFEIRAHGILDGGLLRIEPLRIQLGDAQVTAEGVFDIPPDLSRTNVKITGRAANLARLGTINERPFPETDFSLDARFIGTPESFSIEQLAILSADSNLTGSIVVHLDREVPDVILNLQSDYLDVTPLLAVNSAPATGVDSIDDQDSKVSVRNGRLIPDLALPLKQLTKFNAVAGINIASYRQNLRKVENLVFDVKLLDGRLDVERASGQTPFGSVFGTLKIEPTDNSALVHAEFKGEDLVFGLLEERSFEELEATSKYKLSVDLDGAGLTLRELAANLNGQVQVSTDGGRIENTTLRFIYGDFFSELLSAINPFVKKEPYTDISCIMLVADIENGLFDARPGMAIQTDKLNIISTGTIDLRTEKLDINFKTAPRKKISISAGEFINPYLKVAGTLTEPKLQLDPTGTLVTGGAAVATAGLSLVATAVWDRVVSSSDPCGEVVKQAEKRRENKRINQR